MTLTERFTPESVTDHIAVELTKVRIQTESWDRAGDRNARLRTILPANYLARNGTPIDIVAQNLILGNEQFSGMDESDVIRRIVDFTTQNVGALTYMKGKILIIF